MSANPGADLLSDLTVAQQQAVCHFEGPLLILAGAGSGKTRVITRRVAWLLQQGVRASNILAITFTNKAAAEMRQRVEALAPGNRVFISTFHSLGARLLRQYADRLSLDRNFTIYDTDDRNKLIKSALDSAGMDNVKFTPDRIGGAISKAKNQLITPGKFESTATDFFAKTTAQVYALYEKKLRDSCAMDFDDLLYLPALALRHNDELRSELDHRFRFVLIDEYQDTNQAQYEMAKLLNVEERNLCVVGDPDQSIYKWRSADIRNILDFEKDFPDARTITLEKNYRSSQAILQVANKLIEHNKQRKKKTLITDGGQGERVRVLTFDTGLDEADQVVKRIKEDVQAKRHSYRDHAIFLRINALSRTLESAFIKYAVPFQIVKGLAFFDRKENKDVLAYLRLLVNPQDNLSFLRIVNEPARGIGKVSLDHVQNFAEESGVSLLAACSDIHKLTAIKGKAAGGLKSFQKLMTDLRSVIEQSPEVVIREVLDRSGYRAMLKISGDEEDADRLANIEELITAARQFSTEKPEATIGDFLEQITLASDVDAWDERQDCVSVMTLHSAKGLEFPVVHMLALEQGILPHERSLNHQDDVEEERRLAFVGVTRAMKELFLCHARMREFRGQTLYGMPSMFLEELPAEVEWIDLSNAAGYRAAMDSFRGGNKAATAAWLDTGVAAPPLKPARTALTMPEGSTNNPDEYEAKQVVQHPSYGIGTITEVNGFGAMRKIKIRFAVGGEKTFMASKVQLKIVRRQ